MSIDSNIKFVVKGNGWELKVYNDKLIISRKGFMAFMVHGLKGDKTLFYNQISGIQFREPGTFTNGYMQFTLPGGNESKGGLTDALQDENTFVFASPQKSSALQAKSFIESKIISQSNRSITQESTPSVIGGAEEILKYKGLLDQGIITQEEFNKKKKDILGM